MTGGDAVGAIHLDGRESLTANSFLLFDTYELDPRGLALRELDNAGTRGIHPRWARNGRLVAVGSFLVSG